MKAIKDFRKNDGYENDYTIYELDSFEKTEYGKQYVMLIHIPKETLTNVGSGAFLDDLRREIKADEGCHESVEDFYDTVLEAELKLKVVQLENKIALYEEILLDTYSDLRKTLKTNKILKK